MPTEEMVVTLAGTTASEAWRLPLAAVTTSLLEAEAATRSRMRVATMGGDDAQT